MAEAFHISQRLSYDGQLCTVRYIGPVQGTSGQWLGVEWDDAERGKHAGNHNGVKYFQCASKQSTPASFVRPSRPTDVANDFVEAVKSKYASELGHGVYSVQFNKVDDTIKISGKEVEEVGFEKVRKQLANLKQLRIVVVDTSRIARPRARDSDSGTKSGQDVAEAVPNVLGLDVSRNLFETWSEVTDICRQLTRLTSLRVDGNRFASLDSACNAQQLTSVPFNRIKTLTLSETLLSWDAVAQIARSLPALCSLSANGNEYETLTDAELPSEIESLNLERNNFSTFDSLKTITKLQKLRNLSLRENPLHQLSNDSQRADPPMQFTFPTSLVELNMPYCAISDWSMIDALVRLCPGLTSLRVSHNPLYDTLTSADGKPLTPDDGYMLTLARLSQLTRLNFSTITEKERLNAELYYLSQINHELSLASPKDAPKIVERHSRYPELCRLYGQEGQSSAPKVSAVDPRSLAASLVNLSFKLGDVGLTQEVPERNASQFSKPNETVWTCELPKSYNIYKLVGLVAKRFALRPLSIQLELECPDEGDNAPIEAESDPYSDSSDDGIANGRHRTNARRDREQPYMQTLTPLMRPLDTWVEGSEATIWVRRKLASPS